MGKLVGISAALFILFVVSLLLEGASGSTEVELSTDCTREYTQCIEQDNTNDSVELGKDLKVDMTLRLPKSAFSELLDFNQSKLAVVSIALDIIRGTELLDQDYMDRLDVNWGFELESSRDYGLLKLSLLLLRAEYADTRLLHVEIRTKNVLYKTKGKEWFHVPVSDTDTQTVPSDVEATQSNGMDLGTTTPTYRDHGNDTFKDNLIQCQCQYKSSRPTAEIVIHVLIIVILCRNCGFKLTMLFLNMVMRRLKWTLPWGDPNCSSVTPKLKWKGDELHLWIRWGSADSALTTQASSDEMQSCIEQESQHLILPARTTARPFITNKGQLEYTIQQNP